MTRARAWAGSVLAVAVIGWLAGFWFVYDGWWHRRFFWWAVVPVAALALPLLWRGKTMTWWGALVGALLLLQWVSRTWSGGPATAVAGMGDTLAVALLLTCVFVLARHYAPFARAYLVALPVVSALFTGLSLPLFYASHTLAADRFRNVFVYESGLNPVLTGLLCAAAAVPAISLLTSSESRRGRLFWGGILALHAFALCATQSRTAFLALGVALLVFAVWTRKQAVGPVLCCLCSAVAYYLLVLVLPGDGAASMADLVARGSTGRFSIYQWFLTEMNGAEFLVGAGMATPAEIPEEVLGWHVHHPHSSYLTQFYLTGLAGLALLMAILAVAFWQALRLAWRGTPVWLCLLLGNALALAADGAQVFSLHSIPRIEILLLAVPATIVVALAASFREQAPVKGSTPADA